jgi:hypothetical protein
MSIPLICNYDYGGFPDQFLGDRVLSRGSLFSDGQPAVIFFKTASGVHFGWVHFLIDFFLLLI